MMPREYVAKNKGYVVAVAVLCTLIVIAGIFDYCVPDIRLRMQQQQLQRKEESPTPAETAKKSTREAITEFRAKLASIEQADELIVSVNGDDSDRGVAIIQVSSEWHYTPKGARLELARLLQRTWAMYYDPKNPGQALIRIVDASGQKIGGSGVMGVWVDD